MPSLLLLDTSTNRHFVGDDYVDLAYATGRVNFDLNARVCTIQHSANPDHIVDPQSTTLAWGDSWDRDDMLVDMARDAVNFLCRSCGFILYRSGL